MLIDNTSLPACFASDLWSVWQAVPGHLRPGLWRYWTERLPTGNFLRAVLANDFGDALRRADSGLTSHELKALAYLTLAAPRESVGSSANVDAWIAGGNRGQS